MLINSADISWVILMKMEMIKILPLSSQVNQNHELRKLRLNQSKAHETESELSRPKRSITLHFAFNYIYGGMCVDTSQVTCLLFFIYVMPFLFK